VESGGFVGRERELALLLDGLDDAVSARGGLCLLAGEPGIGKSRLAGELAERARDRGLRPLWGRCWEAGGAPAYWPWVQIMRSYLRGEDGEAIRRQMGPGAIDIAQMLPELRELLPDLPAPPSVDPESVRVLITALSDPREPAWLRQGCPSLLPRRPPLTFRAGVLELRRPSPRAMQRRIRSAWMLVLATVRPSQASLSM
jgi:hypothetical protein